MHTSRFFRLLFVLLLMVSAVSAQQQEKGKNVAYGVVLDNLLHKHINGARIIRLRPDSTAVDTVTTDADNNVFDERNTYYLFMPHTGGDLLLRVEADGYEPLYKHVHVPPFKSRQLVQRLPDILLKKQAREVATGEVRVQATKIKFYMRGDTIVYNADAFNLSEGSMLDALIRQLPGAELKDNGEITVNGEKVESLMLNGEDFFKDNKQLMLDNLPSYTVKDIQVYRKRKQMAEWAGRDIGQKDLVMNVRLKKEYNTAWIANAEAGHGTADRYMSRLFAMRFTDHSSVSMFANLNNVNDQRRPGENDTWTPEKMSRGREAVKTVGAVYAVKDRMQRFNVNGDAQFTHRGGDYLTRTAGENFLPQGDTYTKSENARQSRETSFSTQHKWEAGRNVASGKACLEWDLNMRHFNRGAEAVAATFSENPFAYGTALLDSMRSPQAGALLRRMALNRSMRTTLTRGDEYTLHAEPSLGLSGVQNDLIMLKATANLEGTSSDRFANSRYDYPRTPQAATDYRRQWTDQSRYKQQYGLSGAYLFVFPINMVLIPSYEWRHTRWHDNSPLYRLDRLADWDADDTHAIGLLPSTTDFMRQTLDLQNSAWRHSTLTEHEANFHVQWNTLGDDKAYWNVSVEMPVTFNCETMDYRRATYDGRPTRHFTTFAPNIYVSNYWNNYACGWSLYYNLKAQPTDMVNLLDLVNTSDPLNVYGGNASQRRALTHHVVANYDETHKETDSKLSVRAMYDVVKHAQVMGYAYDVQTGKRHYRPDNVDGNYQMSASVHYERAFDKAKRLHVETHSYGAFMQSVDLVGDVRSTVHTTEFIERLKLRYKFLKQNEIGLVGRVSWNGARSRRDNFERIDAWDFSYGFTAKVHLPLQWQVSTDFTMFSRRGYGDPSANTNDLVWNARLAKSLMHGNLTLALDGFDLLGQLSNVTQTMNSQGRVETYENILPRYVMAHLIYKFSVKPKKERAAAHP